MPITKLSIGIFCLLNCILAGCFQQTDETISIRPREQTSIDRGPTVAEVAGQKIALMEIDDLARLAQDIRSQVGVDDESQVSLENQLQLALEIEALSAVADQSYSLQSPDLRTEYNNLLVRTFLRLFSKSIDQQLYSKEEIADAYEAEKARYFETGESALYRPAMVDCAAIAVGYFPNLRLEPDQELGVLSEENAIKLANEIFKQSGSYMFDLDDFLVLARNNMLGNPTVRIIQVANVPQARVQNSRLDPAISKTLFNLSKNGEIHPPVVSDGAVYIVRRGVSRPGKGEDISEVEDALIGQVHADRKRSAFIHLVDQLREKYKVKVFYPKKDM
jgi:hypothetical protein